MGNVNKKPRRKNKHKDQELESTFTCEICIEPVTLPNTKFKNSSRCGHPFCTNCMIKYIQVKLEDDVSDIKCPALNCHHFLEPLSCRPKITQQLFNKWCDKLCDSTVLGLDRVYCPNRDCSALIINECGNGENLKRCVCPVCKKPFCIRCKVPWHAGYMCDEIRKIRDQNDVAFNTLCAREKWMRCPRCRYCVERVDGCIIIRCRCGIEFCYNCGNKVDRHWCECAIPAPRWILHICLFILIIVLLGGMTLLVIGAVRLIRIILSLGS